LIIAVKLIVRAQAGMGDRLMDRRAFLKTSTGAAVAGSLDGVVTVSQGEETQDLDWFGFRGAFSGPVVPIQWTSPPSRFRILRAGPTRRRPIRTRKSA
jgi:hypothetical protein